MNQGVTSIKLSQNVYHDIFGAVTKQIINKRKKPKTKITNLTKIFADMKFIHRWSIESTTYKKKKILQNGKCTMMVT